MPTAITIRPPAPVETINPAVFEYVIRDVVLKAMNDGELNEVADVRTFAESCVMTRDRGLVLRTTTGQEFRITIVQSN
jgi:hypothetical protein